MSSLTTSGATGTRAPQSRISRNSQQSVYHDPPALACEACTSRRCEWRGLSLLVRGWTLADTLHVGGCPSLGTLLHAPRPNTARYTALYTRGKAGDGPRVCAALAGAARD